MPNTDEAMKIWSALKPMVDKQIEEKTKSCMRSKKMTVTVAPDGSTIGVAEPFGDTVQIPYLSGLSEAQVGDAVWVNWYYNSASTMSAAAMGDGQTPSAVSEPYPVGSIYLSVNSTSPADLFGGTWERINDCFLLAAGTTYAPGDTGGESSHTLTFSEMPSHTHYQQGFLTVSPSTSSSAVSVRARDYNGSDPIDTTSASLGAGGGQPHNNMPPYLAVYVWKRTA